MVIAFLFFGGPLYLCPIQIDIQPLISELRRA